MDPVADAPYLSRHIIGLVKEQSLFEVTTTGETLMSKVGFQYDETGSIQGMDAPVGHDNSYDGNFITGRANLSSVKRYDVINSGQWTVSSMRYNTAGSVVSTKDPLNHEVTISYADSFSEKGIDLDAPRSFSTLAFPTTITDADGFSSHVRYHYDFGARTRVASPPPANQSVGAIQLFAYDGAGRIDRVTTANNGAYQRFVYGPNYVQTFATVNTIADEAYSFQLADGAGRTIAAARNHPGSVGGYSAVVTVFDQTGRAVKQSNPTETTASGTTWPATGDDAYNPQTGEGDWRYTEQTYDWQGRSRITTNTDGTTKEASYSGCGCAGGAVVTLTDEGTMDAGVLKRRQQKIYADILGRTVKTEILNWQGGSVYSTTVNSYNARDQVTLVRQYAGQEGSGTHQETITTYDGYGRLETKHAPEQNGETATRWNYNADDSIQSLTDSRGASATYSYNNRKLMTAITHLAPTGITPTPNVTYGYDGAGNRTSMTDGLGTATYHYDQLSRMDWEERTVDGLGPYRLTYGYNVSGQLASLIDASGVLVSFSRDNIGRLSGITGTNFTSSDQYIEDRQYRAWGALKHFSYGTQSSNTARTSAALTYDARLRTTRYELTSTMVHSSVTGAEFEHNDDGTLRYARQLSSTLHDRRYSYDHTRRITGALTGAEARFETNPDPNFVPFHQNYSYDAFDNITSRTGIHWGHNVPSLNAQFTNNRTPSWTYDPDGRVLEDSLRQFTYDAAGQSTSINEAPRGPGRPALNMAYVFDGDGNRVKTVQSGTVRYELRSTVLGGRSITDLDAQGAKTTGYVYADGELIAKQMVQGSTKTIALILNSPDGSGQWESLPVGVPTRTLELDPFGADAGVDNPYLSGDGVGDYPAHSSLADFDSGCTLDGGPISCGIIAKWFSRNRANILDRLSRRPIQGTPSTFPSTTTQTTFNTILRDMIEDTPLGGLLYPKADWRFINPTFPWGSLYANPQNPASTPTPCPGTIPEGIARQILGIASQEGIDPTLLSVAMRHESSFGTNMTPNERWEGRGRNRKLVGWDVGPMQLATNIWQKSPFIDGLANPFGTVAMNGSTRQYDSFNGNFDENVTVAARAFSKDILPRSHGKDWLHRNADASGMYRGPGDYQGRYDQYLREAPGDRRQLNCIAGRR